MPTPIVKKLLIKPNMQIALLDAPDGFLETVQPMPDGVQIATDATAPAEMILAFARQQQDVDRLYPMIAPLLTPTTLFWIAYPKGGKGTDLNRDRLWQLIGTRGWNAVTLIALDDVWSAMRFRPGKE